MPYFKIFSVVKKKMKKLSSLLSEVILTDFDDMMTIRDERTTQERYMIIIQSTIYISPFVLFTESSI